MMIVNYTSSIVNKLEALVTDNARVIIYNCQVFIVQSTGLVFAGKAGAYQSGAPHDAQL